MAEGALRAGWGYTGEQSRPRGGGIGCAEAGTTSGEGWGTLRSKEQARGGAKSTRLRAGVVDRRGRNEINIARGKVPHLGMAFREARRGVWSSGWTARRAHFSG
jgi:hypothetical protein